MIQVRRSLRLSGGRHVIAAGESDGRPEATGDLDSHRWGVILASGDGKRLLPLTRRITGDERPKQFCALTGSETLLKQTRRRVGRMVLAPQTLLVMTRAHECYYADNVAGVSSTCLLVQPHNHGTAAAIAYGLTRVGQTDPLGIVAFFPSDHHFANEEAFITYVDWAFIQAKSHPERVILLGIEPEAAEDAYGWIEPGSPLASGSSTLVSEVSRFWEKPPRRVASLLMRRGCLWNSFVMVGTVGAFRNLIQHTLPDLLSCFESMPPMVVSSGEHRVLGEIYHKLPPADFSGQVLSARPSNLAVIRGRGLGWSDLGDPERALSVLNHKGLTSKAEASG